VPDRTLELLTFELEIGAEIVDIGRDLVPWARLGHCKPPSRPGIGTGGLYD
jgi:hypothetical protein